MSFDWSAEDFLKKKYGSDYVPTASSGGDSWSADEFLREKYEPAPSYEAAVVRPGPSRGFDLSRLIGWDDFTRSIEGVRAKDREVEDVARTGDFGRTLTKVGENLAAKMGLVAQVPVVGGVVQGLSAIPMALFGGAAVASGDPRVSRAYLEGSRTLEGDEPAPWDVPAVIRGLGAAQAQRTTDLGSLAENESLDMGARARAAIAEKAYQFGPFAVPLPSVRGLRRGLSVEPAAPAASRPLALPPGESIPMRPPVPPVGSTVTPGSEIVPYQQRFTFENLRPRIEPMIDGEFREIAEPVRPRDVRTTSPQLLGALQRAVDESSARMRPRDTTPPAEVPTPAELIRSTTDDTLMRDLAASIRAKGGVVPEGFGLGRRERAVHDANEAAIAAFRDALRTGETGPLQSAIAAVKDLGGDLAHTAKRIREATGEGPTASELAAIARTRVASASRRFLRESAGEAPMDTALAVAEAILKAASRSANTRRPPSMAELIEAGAPREKIIKAREEFFARLRDVETPYRAAENEPGDWVVMKRFGEGGVEVYPPIKPTKVIRATDVRPGDRVSWSGDRSGESVVLRPAEHGTIEIGETARGEMALGRAEPGTVVRLADGREATIPNGEYISLRGDNSSLPMLKDIPEGTMVEVESPRYDGTTEKVKWLGMSGRDVAMVEQDGRKVTWGRGDARARPLSEPPGRAWEPHDAFETLDAANRAMEDARNANRLAPGPQQREYRVMDRGRDSGRLRYEVQSNAPGQDGQHSVIVAHFKDAAEATARAAELNAQANKPRLRFAGGSSRFLGEEAGSARVETAEQLAQRLGRTVTRDDLVRIRAERRGLTMDDLRPRPSEGPKRGIGRDVYESIRSLKSLIDLPLGRQGIRVIGNPIAFAKGAAESIIAYKKGPQYAKQWVETKQKDPNWKRYVETGGLELTDPTAGSVVGKIGREELFPGGKIEKASVLGGAIQHSNAAYTHSLNVMRWEKMKGDLQMAEFLWKHLLRRKGPLPDAEVKAIGRLVNVSTGRGYVGKLPPRVSDALGSTFFSPRNTASWPEFFADWARAAKEGNHAAAIVSAKTLAAWLGFAVAVLKATEDKDNPVEWDPRSADFMKVRDGDRRTDIMGGGQQWIVALSRIASGETRGGDKKVKSIDTDDVIGSFIMNRTHPAISTIEQSGRLTLAQLRNALSGKPVTGTTKDPYGNEYGYAEVALGAAAPIIAEQFIDEVRFLMEADRKALDEAIAEAAKSAGIAFPGFGVDRYRSGVKMPPMGGSLTPKTSSSRSSSPSRTPTPTRVGVAPRTVR